MVVFNVVVEIVSHQLFNDCFMSTLVLISVLSGVRRWPGKDTGPVASRMRGFGWTEGAKIWGAGPRRWCWISVLQTIVGLTVAVTKVTQAGVVVAHIVSPIYTCSIFVRIVAIRDPVILSKSERAVCRNGRKILLVAQVILLI